MMLNVKGRRRVVYVRLPKSVLVEPITVDKLRSIRHQLRKIQRLLPKEVGNRAVNRWLRIRPNSERILSASNEELAEIAKEIEQERRARILKASERIIH